MAMNLNPTLNTMHLKSITEALDGYRTGETVFVILLAESEPQCDARIYDGKDRPGAVSLAAELTEKRGKQYIVEGPYQTEKDLVTDEPDARNYALIVHGELSPPKALPTGYYGKFRDLADVYVQFKKGDGTLHPLTPLSLRPDESKEVAPSPTRPWTDAVFFSFAAVDKFLIPYYARLYGADYAAKIRSDLAKDAHKARKSFYDALEL